MTPDEQEALSIKYSYRSFMVAKLSSGNWALYDRGFKLLFICKTWEELEQHYKPINQVYFQPIEIKRPISDDDLNSILGDLL